MTAWLQTADRGAAGACVAYLSTKQVCVSLGVLLGLLTAAG